MKGKLSPVYWCFLLPRNTPPGKKAQVTFSITPRRNMKRKGTLIVTCQSQKLKGIMGTATVRVS